MPARTASSRRSQPLRRTAPATCAWSPHICGGAGRGRRRRLSAPGAQGTAVAPAPDFRRIPPVRSSPASRSWPPPSRLSGLCAAATTIEAPLAREGGPKAPLRLPSRTQNRRSRCYGASDVGIRSTWPKNTRVGEGRPPHTVGVASGLPSCLALRGLLRLSSSSGGEAVRRPAPRHRPRGGARRAWRPPGLAPVRTAQRLAC